MTMTVSDLLIGTSNACHVRRCLSMLRGPNLTLLVRRDRKAEISDGIATGEVLTYDNAPLTPAVLARAEDGAVCQRRWHRVYVVFNDYQHNTYASVIAAAHGLNAQECWGVLPNLDVLPLARWIMFLQRWQRIIRPLLALFLYALYLPLLVPVILAAYACSRLRRFTAPTFAYTVREPRRGGDC